MKLFRKLWKRSTGERGQSMTEYMLVISVLVIGAVAVTYSPMRGAFKDGSDAYKQKVGKATDNGHFGGQDDAER